jgi:hypothetical protein
MFQKQLYSGIPNVTVWRVLRKRLYLKAYELFVVQVVERGSKASAQFIPSARNKAHLALYRRHFLKLYPAPNLHISSPPSKERKNEYQSQKNVSGE